MAPGKPVRRRLRIDRLIVAGLSLSASFVLLDYIEKRRAVLPPPGWARAQGDPLAPEATQPNIMTSAWRIGPATTWQAQESAGQLYLRAESTDGLGLSLAGDVNQGIWIWLSDTLPARATLDGEPLTCMGQVTPPDDTEPVELTAQQDGLLVRWGSTRMVCPDATDKAQRAALTPAIKTGRTSVLLRSIGRDRSTDGVPLSPLWWMSGLMVGGMVGMLAFDWLILLAARIRPKPVLNEE